jgi:hypothetical protein
MGTRGRVGSDGFLSPLLASRGPSRRLGRPPTLSVRRPSDGSQYRELAIACGERHHSPMEDYEAVAQELSAVAEKLRLLEQRMAEVERVNARLEEAA